MSQQENQMGSSNFDWVCQAMSATEETCKLSATCHCTVCGKWLCAVHADEEAWRRCALEPCGLFGSREQLNSAVRGAFDGFNCQISIPA